MQHLQSGTTLQGGKYRIEEHLASGGFGNTYSAIATEFNVRVAIKEFFIKDTMERDERTSAVSVSRDDQYATFQEQKNKFRKEALRLRQLQNEYIVRVYDLFEENGTAYYVMDYIDGEDLSKRMKRTGRAMTENEVTLILPKVLDALQSVHEAGFWHMDIKPGNIMLEKGGNIKLIDFGASKQLNAKSGGAAATSNVASTDRYAPLEQTEKSYSKMGPWTDIYSLGATLYSLLTNSIPPSASDINDDVDGAFVKLNGVSKKMRDLIVWMMNTNRAKRPQSVDEVINYVRLNLNVGAENRAQSSFKQNTSHTGSTTSSFQQTMGDETVIKTNNHRRNNADESTILKGKRNQDNNTAVKSGHNESTSSSKKGDDSSISRFYAAIGFVLVIILISLGVTNIKIHDSASNNPPPTPSKSNSYSGFAAKDIYTSVGQGRYEGDLKDGIEHGRGTITYSNGMKFTGCFKDGETHGHGTLYAANGKVLFDGEYKNGDRVSGTQYYANGNKFTGTYEYGDPKNGTLRSATGEVLFKGEFLGGQKWTGTGKEVDGDYSYEGGYKGGVYDGKGIQRWKNAKDNYGYMYEGEFKNGYRNGYGTMYYKGGDWYEGAWVDNYRTGKGTYYYSNHTYETGIWKNNKLIKETEGGSSSDN